MSGSPMIGEVDKIVGNLLIAEGMVFIPRVGTLHIDRRGARKLSAKRIEPPYRVVEFSSQPESVSLTKAIAQAAGCDEAASVDICNRWLEHTFKDGVLTIGGVGVLHGKSFTMDPAFDKLLNPQGHEPLLIYTNRGGHWLLWTLASVAIACGIGVCGWIVYDRWGLSVVEQTAHDLAAGTAPASDIRPDFRSLDPGSSKPLSGDQTPLPPAERAVEGMEPLSEAEGLVHETSGEAGNPTAASEGRNHAEGMTSRPSGDRAFRSTDGPTARPSEASEPHTPGSSVREPGPMDAAPLVSGHTYVVLGVYSTLENAQRAVRDISRREPALKYRIYRYGPKYMVSIFSSESSEAGAAFVRAYADRFPDVWTYRAK